ncbi:MAG: hypothetical protein ACYS67_04540 [Planctomycetota bacterium]|jgi:hypothetical protein
MTISQKQLEANKKNAQKGGVKTQEGKAIVKYNALKHGLLAKEVVVTVGEGAENPEEFNALLEDLKTQLAPEGTLEEMLVEKVAVAYWRLRRAYKYEVGLIRQELDTATDDYYDGKTSTSGYSKQKTDSEIEKEIEQQKETLDSWIKDKKDFIRIHKQGKSLKDIYDWEGNWEWLFDKYSYLFPDDEREWTPKGVREYLNNKDWSDEDIWQALIEICDKKVIESTEEIDSLNKQKKKHKLKLQVIRKLGGIPSKEELNRLLRYEGAIERQLYKAMNQLERLQRMRSGDDVPAPVEVDVDVNTGQSG